MEPTEQVSAAVESDEHLVERLEGLGEADHDFSVEMFGASRDVEGVAALRLGEHALHTWDIAVALDPAATVSPDAVALLLEGLPALATRAGSPSDAPATLRVAATGRPQVFAVTTGPEVRLLADDGAEPADVVLPAEALVRLVYGRLDEGHTPDGITGAEHLPTLRAVFPGF